MVVLLRLLLWVLWGFRVNEKPNEDLASVPSDILRMPSREDGLRGIRIRELVQEALRLDLVRVVRETSWIPLHSKYVGEAGEPKGLVLLLWRLLLGKPTSPKG